MPTSQQHLYQQHQALQLQEQRMQTATSSNLPNLLVSHLQQLEPMFTDSLPNRSQAQHHQPHHAESRSVENTIQVLSSAFQSNQFVAVPSTSSDDNHKEVCCKPVPGKPYGNLLNAEFVVGNKLKVNSFEPPSCPVDSNWGCFVYYERETQIGRLQENGDVWVQVYTGRAIFVHSHYLDRESGRGAGDVVHKVYPGAKIKIFDLNNAKAILRQHMVACQMAREYLSGHKTPMDDLFRMYKKSKLDDEAKKGADDMKRFCVARISFVKGWGPDYRRRTISECPCWIEVKMNRAFQYLDELMHEI
ncbi:Mothers against decapentaplegic 4 [Parelaphostrongylus tenuis]|uniref:Mothers against decapentaplegic 4 n=1 Tax=Parelaphostrongylus tenuis TaxID=148309 RepID=A0AAD5N0N1_PARTN|nr:Mothers against decapentaplegic 4 [Parelaphostrongylus tenuis]